MHMSQSVKRATLAIALAAACVSGEATVKEDIPTMGLAAGTGVTCELPREGMFNPCATLDTTQVQDRRGNPAAYYPAEWHGHLAPEGGGYACASYETSDGIGWVCVPVQKDSVSS